MIDIFFLMWYYCLGDDLIMNVTIGVSNRHVHLRKSDLEILFGKDAELTVKKKILLPLLLSVKLALTLSYKTISFLTILLIITGKLDMLSNTTYKILLL